MLPAVAKPSLALPAKAADRPRNLTAAARTRPRYASSARRVCVRCEGVINDGIKKDEAKVVDVVNSSDIESGKKGVYCRCWKSKTFPLCDGSHMAHNKETGDNVGPLIVNQDK